MKSNVLKSFWIYNMPKPIPIVPSKLNLFFSLFVNIGKNNNSLGKEFEERCPICLNFMSFKIRPNTCFHFFCFDCITKWSTIKKVCPLCKRSFSGLSL